MSLITGIQQGTLNSLTPVQLEKAKDDHKELTLQKRNDESIFKSVGIGQSGTPNLDKTDESNKIAAQQRNLAMQNENQNMHPLKFFGPQMDASRLMYIA